MNLIKLILNIILIEVATNCFVKGLQCYVCEDCNENEDFKELHICGEIPIVTTVKPITLPDILGGSTTIKPSRRPSVAPSLKPTENTTIDDYLYEDSGERHDNINATNSTQNNAIREDSTQIITTQKPTSLNETSTTQKTTALDERSTLTTTQYTRMINESNADSKATTTTGVVTTTKPIPDYDDYLEYEDPLNMKRSEEKSLLKINDPVCYMIRYHANNTIVTNRGCTNSIYANKYLTCQSLYNGALMETCSICSTNGCNKFLDGDGYEDNYGSGFNAAAALHHSGIFILLLWIMFSRAFI